MAALLALNTVTTVLCLPVSKRRKCPELTESEKRAHREPYEEPHWTFWLLPFMQQSMEGTREIGILEDTRSTHVYGPRSCQKKKHIDRESDCPTQFVMHHDANRIPKNLVYAKCVCDTCRHDSDNHAKKCQPVYTLTRVQRRHHDDCEFKWTYDKVPVACTCKSVAKVVLAKEVNHKDVPITQHNFSD